MIVRIGIFLLGILFFSCATEPHQPEFVGTYYAPEDTCRRFVFLPDQQMEFRRLCSDGNEKVTVLTESINGDLVELYCSGTLSYQVDSIDQHGGRFVFAHNEKGELCISFHAMMNEDYLVLSPLKASPGIEFHMTSAHIYETRSAIDSPVFDRELVIRLKNPVCDSMIYLAYSQLGIQNHRQTENGVVIDLENECHAFKTDYEIDPTYLAFEQYKFELYNPSTNDYDNVPVIYDEGYSRYRELDDDAKRLFLQQQNIDGPHFIVAYRFNPGRERVVNEVYGEAINGQVQTFEYVRTE